MNRNPFHVIVAGGGVAALECVLALHELVGHQTRVTLLSPQQEFIHRQFSVGEAFGRRTAQAYPLTGFLQGPNGGELILDTLAAVDAEARCVSTGRGRRLGYDALVVATGARPRAWLQGALTFTGPDDVGALSALLAELVAGQARSVAFALPSEGMWPLPLYELAMMTAEHLREHSSAAEVWLVTPEERPLGLFGPAAANALAPMLADRGVRVRTSARAKAVRGRALALAGSGEVWVDRVVTLPVLEGPAISGLPANEHGFLCVDAFGRVQGRHAVYAAGDATSFSLKQGGLAAQQADAVAEAIAASLGAAVIPQPFRPVLRGMLMTSGAPLYLRAEPQRLAHDTSVAIEACPRHLQGLQRFLSTATGQPLWWPPTKVAGRYLAPWLAAARPSTRATEQLTDRVATAGAPDLDDDYNDALELTLLLADGDARWGDFGAALSALDAAQALHGALPPEYERKRHRWMAAGRA
jgi:sulfide:quinone oxidoreductase